MCVRERVGEMLFCHILIFNDASIYLQYIGSDVINSTFSPSVIVIFVTHSGNRMSKRLLSV